MLFTNHLLAGALLGRALARPVPALVVGIASHVAMDKLPHWGAWDERTLLKVARVDGLLALGVATLAVRRSDPPHRAAVVSGMVGAGLLDLDKPGRHFAGRSPFPARLDAWHGRIQTGERRHRWWIDAIAAVGLAGTLWRVIGSRST